MQVYLSQVDRSAGPRSPRRADRQGRRPDRRHRRPLSAGDRPRRQDRAPSDLPALGGRRELRRARRPARARRPSTSTSSSSATTRSCSAADLMDKQIVDIDGRKVVRVNDLRLDEIEGTAPPGGGRRRSRRAAPAAGHRGPVPDGRAQPAPARSRALHRLGGRRPGRDLDRLDQLRVPHAGLPELHPADLATIIDQLAPPRPSRRPGRRSTTRLPPTPSRRWSPRPRSRSSRTSSPSARPTSSRR